MIIKRLFQTVFMASFTTLIMAGCASHSNVGEAKVEPLWDVDGKQNKIVVISDLHLGIKDEYAETLENRPHLVKFLQRLCNTKDVRELVIAGDFLDEWYLPVYYPSYTDEEQFYKDVIANNQDVIDEINHVIESGIKVVYVVGNHDMTLAADVLQEAIPNIEQARDVDGLGAYRTGDRDEIVIEHGHRYDVFSAPDTVTNAELCGNDDTILPSGYFFARYAATWVLEGYPKVEKNLPVITNIPEQSDTDQYGAYAYYSVLKNITEKMTINEKEDEEIFDIHIAGFDDKYSYLDFYPAEQADGTISAPVLYKNIQKTWDERQENNNIKVKNSFLEAVSGAVDWKYYFEQAKAQYLENPDENVDVVVFGHTHVPVYSVIDGGKLYINDGTWVDHNANAPELTRIFAVITTGEKTTAGLYKYEEDESISDIKEDLNGTLGSTSENEN